MCYYLVAALLCGGCSLLYTEMEGEAVELMNEQKTKTKTRVLCLHGFRTSGSFSRKQISKWDSSIFQHFQMEFPDGLSPAGGSKTLRASFLRLTSSGSNSTRNLPEYTNLEECISFLCDYMTKKGSFDGLLGFSQGATLSALLIGYQD